MTSLSEKPRVTRPAVALLVASLSGVPWQATAFANEPDDVAARAQAPSRRDAVTDRPFSPDEAMSGATIRATALRLALAESDRLERSPQGADASPGERCTASVAEKLAWIYALVGGSILLAYGPKEKNGDVWTMDGKSETVAGAAAIGLSFALLHDIRRKGW